jgi:hypothetical protein
MKNVGVILEKIGAHGKSSLKLQAASFRLLVVIIGYERL